MDGRACEERLTVFRITGKSRSPKQGCEDMRVILYGAKAGMFRLASLRRMAFPAACMSLLPTADLLALDTAGLKSRLSKLRRYL
jgi:hypothetical protein